MLLLPEHGVCLLPCAPRRRLRLRRRGGVPYQPNGGSPADRWLDQSERRGRYGGLGHLGPYATIRRANEVAAYYRSLGYNASAPYHNGNGYYVDVR